jgi:hypothetical protein
MAHPRPRGGMRGGFSELERKLVDNSHHLANIICTIASRMVPTQDRRESGNSLGRPSLHAGSQHAHRPHPV